MRGSAAGVVLGIGLGGFADGILLHQIAQWHNMGSAVLPPITVQAMRLNMAWDGLFHLAVWVITVTGIFLLWKGARDGTLATSAVSFAGELVFGWGAFNLAEGLVDHHLLELHHVRDLPVHVPPYDWLYLAVGGVGFLVAGWAMMGGFRRRAGT